MSDTTESESFFLCEECKDKIHGNRTEPPRTNSTATIPLPGVCEVLKNCSCIFSTDANICHVCKLFSPSIYSSDLAENIAGPETGPVNREASISTVDATITRAENFLLSIAETLPNLDLEESIISSNNGINLNIAGELLQDNGETEQQSELQENFNIENNALNFFCEKQKKNSINMFIRGICTINTSENMSVTETIQCNVTNYATLQDKINSSESINTSGIQDLLDPQTDSASSCNTDDLIQTITDNCLEKNFSADRDVASEQSQSYINSQYYNLYLDNKYKNDRIEEWIATIPETNNYNPPLHNTYTLQNELAENPSSSDLNILVPQTTDTGNQDCYGATSSDNIITYLPNSFKDGKSAKEYINKAIKDSCLTKVANAANTTDNINDDTESSSLHSIFNNNREENWVSSSVLGDNDHMLNSTINNLHSVNCNETTNNNSQISPLLIEPNCDENRNNDNYEDSYSISNEETEKF